MCSEDWQDTGKILEVVSEAAKYIISMYVPSDAAMNLFMRESCRGRWTARENTKVQARKDCLLIFRETIVDGGTRE